MHVLTYKSPFFALKYLTRYTHETFFKEYTNFEGHYLRRCRDIPLQSTPPAARIRVNPLPPPPEQRMGQPQLEAGQPTMACFTPKLIVLETKLCTRTGLTACFISALPLFPGWGNKPTELLYRVLAQQETFPCFHVHTEQYGGGQATHSPSCTTDWFLNANTVH